MQPIYILQPISSTAAAVAEIQLPIAGLIKIGREASNDFSFPHDTKMSSAHFEVSAEAGCCRARDLGSSNGLFLNTKRISTALLVEGDELQAGDSRWRVVVRGGQPAPYTAVPYTAETPLDQSRGFAPPPVAVSLPQPSLVHSDAAHNDLQLASDRGVVRIAKQSERLTIGRTSLANWVFEHDGQMSSLHLEVFCEAGVWRVKDLGSSNGTFLNESRVNEARLRTGDEIRAGQTRFVVVLSPSEQPVPPTSSRAVEPLPAATPYRQQSVGKPLSPSMAILRRVTDGREFELPVGTTVQLGRARGLPISLPDDLEVSTQHATVVFDGQVVQLQDTGSSNGTYVGTQRVSSCQLKDGQRFRVGQTLLLVCLPRPESPTEESRPTAVETLPIEGSPLAVAPLTPQIEPQPSSSSTSSLYGVRRDAPIIPVRRFSGANVHRAPVDKDPRNNPPELFPASAAADERSLANEPAADAEDLHSQHLDADSEQSGSSDKQVDESELYHDSESRATNAESEVYHGSEPSSDERIAAEPIDWQSPAAYANTASEIEGVVCRSGLIVYRGQSSGLDPVDVGLRLLQITSGWVLNGGDIENWMEAARQGLKGLPREWLNPAKSDDASWMLPFLSNWGSGKAWLVFSSVDLDDALQNILSLRPISEDAPPLMPALTPTELANFLAEHDQRAVARFFQPFDAIMLEIRAGQSWALFSRHNLQTALRQ